MLVKTIDEIVAKYPWPPCTFEASLRVLLSHIQADPEMEDQRWVAYLLATARWETQYTYSPVEENGKGAGHSYGVPDPQTGKAYYGRGYVQITFKDNYARFSPIVGQDLVNHPELALEPDVAYKIASVGMRGGMFTGVGLHHYIHDDVADYVNARRIINGLDKADTIASFAEAFEKILK